jgi:hypothetical protein
MSTISQNTKKRSIYWNFELYEESAPTDYLEILKSFQVSFALSPWHDHDNWSKQDELDNPAHIAGTPKKKHRHGIFKFEGMKSFDQVKELTTKLNAPIPIRTISITKSVQYFVHKNDPEKYQYDKSEIIDYCFGVEEYFTATATLLEKRQYLREMVAWAKENKILRMNQLIDEALYNRADTWAKLFEDSPRWAIEKYINAQWQENESLRKTPTVEKDMVERALEDTNENDDE